MKPLKPGDRIGPFRYGGDMDDPNNPANPFGISAPNAEEWAKQIMDALPPSRKQAESIIAAWEAERRVRLLPFVQIELLRRLTQGLPIPPLPSEVNHNPYDWKVQPETEAWEEQRDLLQLQVADRRKQEQSDTREVKLFDRLVGRLLGR